MLLFCSAEYVLVSVKSPPEFESLLIEMVVTTIKMVVTIICFKIYAKEKLVFKTEAVRKAISCPTMRLFLL